MNQTDKILSYILNENEGDTFYSFSNADGKQWLMPIRNMKTAMNLYQPSGIKGKWMKSLFPYLCRIKPVGKAIHAERRKYALPKDLEDLLCRLFGANKIEFSIFCGTPCVHQKITMQISKGKQILGYCKFSDNEEIINIFQKEKETLDYLREQGIKSIPQCLYCGRMDNGIGLFVQTTTKSIHSTTTHEWSIREESFLKELNAKTKRKLPFEQTDFYQDLCFLNDYASGLTDFDISGIQKGINLVMERFGEHEVVFSFYHADFTPWNMYVEQGQLFVFDFEYAKRTYPPYLDYFHFFTQTAIFEKHLFVDKIGDLYRQDRKKINTFFQDPDFAYLCYLLSIVAHYVKREKGVFQGDVLQNMRLWIGLITRICNATAQ